MLNASNLDVQSARLVTTIDSGDYWMQEIGAGETMRITDLRGNQAVDTLFLNADSPIERYSAFDTIRRQQALYLTTGSVLVSDEGNPMLEIIADGQRFLAKFSPVPMRFKVPALLAHFC